MKKAIVLMIGILLLGINLTAEAGDFIVEGNVGVGTTTPAAPLDVNGNINVNGNIIVSQGNWAGIYFGSRAGLIWKLYNGGTPSINSKSLVIGQDDYVAEIYFDTIYDGFWAYCEGIVGSGAGINCADYDGTMTANDNFWVWKHGGNDSYPQSKDLKFVFDGQSNDGVMGFMDDEDAFYFDEKLGIGTNTPSSKLDVNSSTGYNQLRLRAKYTPTGTNDTNGNVGDIAWDDNYTYVKTSAGWKRSQLTTW